MLQSSYCVGNVFVYFYFRGKSEIDKETRDIVSSGKQSKDKEILY